MNLKKIIGISSLKEYKHIAFNYNDIFDEFIIARTYDWRDCVPIVDKNLLATGLTFILNDSKIWRNHNIKCGHFQIFMNINSDVEPSHYECSGWSISFQFSQIEDIDRYLKLKAFW
jgi:hypothetical protein